MGTSGAASGESEGPPGRALKTGDHHHRAYVGPPDQYDLMGATQFALLYALGMRSDQRLLDIGCGSLRAGRLFIAYLDPGGYVGLEPNTWLVEDAIEKELGRDVLALKAPTFLHNDTFDISGAGVFDFVVAQSIASHTGPTMTKQLLRTIRTGLAPTGMAVVTFMPSGRADNSGEGWFYPGCVVYRRRTIESWIRDAGMTGVPIAWFHPRQTWWILVPDAAPMAPALLRWSLRGGTLAMARSWNPVVGVRRRARRWRTSAVDVVPPPTRRVAVVLRAAVRTILSGRGRRDQKF